MDLEYIEMMNHIENDTECENIPPESKLKHLKDVKDRMSIVTLEAGTRLIVKNESEITHSAEELVTGKFSSRG